MLPAELKDQLYRAVALANPSSGFGHLLDEKRLVGFFDACVDAGIEPTPAIIDSNWPQNTITGLGGDPAHSDKVHDGAYRVLADWKSKRR